MHSGNFNSINARNRGRTRGPEVCEKVIADGSHIYAEL